MNHLAEMLRASGVSAELDVSTLPALPGAEELLGSGLRSTAHEQNRNIAKAIRIEPEASRHPRLELLFDPQTAGGFLAGVPAAKAEDFLGRLRDANVEAVRIGNRGSPSGRRRDGHDRLSAVMSANGAFDLRRPR